MSGISGVKPFIPPNRRGQFMRDCLGVGMDGIDQDIAVKPCRYRRHDQDRRPRLLYPRLPKAFADGFAISIPSGMVGRLEHFIAGAVGNRNADIMLVGWYDGASAHQLFEHRGRIIFGRIDDRAGWRIPAPRIKPRALRIVDGICTFRITNPETGEDAIRFLRAHTPPPYAIPPSRLMTASAPGPVASATSSGGLLSSITWGRLRNSRTLPLS